MSNVKIELNQKGVVELFKSPEVLGWLDDLGSRVAQTAGAEYNHDAHLANFTAICTVFPDSEDAAHDNFRNNTLLKAAGTIGSVGEKPRL